MPRFDDRTAAQLTGHRRAQELRPFLLERFFARHEFSAPFNLCASDSEPMHVGELLALEQGAAEALHRQSLGYTETQGAPELRHEIAALYERVEPSEVVVHAGGEEAVFTLMHAALRRGDHVVVQHPVYQSLHEVARAIGCEISLWKVRAGKGGWQIDLGELRALLRPTTRLVTVNFPHNPTGALPGLSAWRELVEVVSERRVRLFSDEAYRGLEYNEADRLPSACDLYDGAVSLGLLSKGYGLAGLRIGWLATRDDELRRRIAEIKDYTTICSSAPSEFLAAIALRNANRLLQRARAYIGAHLPLVAGFFARHGDRFDWRPPDAGPVAYVGLRSAEGIDVFCREVLENASVLLLPGTVFEPRSSCFRIGFGRSDLPQALARLDAYIGRRA